MWDEIERGCVLEGGAGGNEEVEALGRWENLGPQRRKKKNCHAGESVPVTRDPKVPNSGSSPRGSSYPQVGTAASRYTIRIGSTLPRSVEISSVPGRRSRKPECRVKRWRNHPPNGRIILQERVPTTLMNGADRSKILSQTWPSRFESLGSELFSEVMLETTRRNHD